MSNGREGGIWALAGYLYQIVGMLSITARISSLPLKPDTTDDILVNLYDVGGLFIQAEHEAAGQDALLRFRSLKLNENDDCVLLQFKYSMTDRPIGGPELKKIIKSLDKSVKKVSRDGQDVTACVLITSRRFTSGRNDRAEEVWEVEKTKARAYQLRRVPDYSDYSIERFISELKGFGKEYGAFREEIKQGIGDLIGTVILDTGRFPHYASVDKKDLIKAFTHHREARRITIASVAELSRKELDQFSKNIGVDQWNSTLIEREGFEDVVEAASQRALVGLYGPGGCGKSVLLGQLLDRFQAIGCCTVQHASNIERSWVKDTVQRWRNLPRTTDNPEESIQRLMTANPGSQRPIMWLCLDGLDEGEQTANRESHIRDVVQWFWKKDCDRGNGLPAATLIVSCRNEDDLQRKWLQLPPPPFYAGELPVAFQVSDFSEPELDKVAEQCLPDEVYRRTRSKFGIQSDRLANDYGILTFGSVPLFPQSNIVNEKVWESLKHPAMWLALLSLPSAATQKGAIEGQRHCVDSLAHTFIKWFRWKLQLRKQQFLDLSEDDLIGILQAIAQESSGTEPNDREEHWVEPSPGTHIHPDDAKVLYSEAELAGLIIRLDARLRWRWRHSIVYDYLTSNAQAG